uniref:Uncharacterized protein n=1 Tax=Rhizophora mucronata TaxID=61149 RepID=A0A2P2QVJ0_RHIMU
MKLISPHLAMKFARNLTRTLIEKRRKKKGKIKISKSQKDQTL